MREMFEGFPAGCVKAHYSKHFEVSEEALIWLGERAADLHMLVKTVCEEHLARLRDDAEISKPAV